MQRLLLMLLTHEVRVNVAVVLLVLEIIVVVVDSVVVLNSGFLEAIDFKPLNLACERYFVSV